MPEVENEIIIGIPASKFYFSTQCNGDKLVLSNLALSQGQAASLTWLINLPPETELQVQIKQKE